MDGMGQEAFFAAFDRHTFCTARAVDLFVMHLGGANQ